jgi:hypothetical protein
MTTGLPAMLMRGGTSKGLYVLRDGEIFCHGTPEETLNPTVLRQVFGVDGEVSVHPLTNKLNITVVPPSLRTTPPSHQGARHGQADRTRESMDQNG